MKDTPMTRDYSQFMPSSKTAQPAERQKTTLERMGWQPFFAQQSDLNETEQTPPVRVTEVHRSALHVVGNGVNQSIAVVPDATVGDWIMLNRDLPHDSRVLERKSLIKRRAPGTDRSVQLIAANIDTVFIVSSCNADFNVARLERYIALAFEAEITPVIVLTKADLAEDVSSFAEEAVAISEEVAVVALDARGADVAGKLAPWCKPGQTVAFLGSSGVGKSTLTNTLMGDNSVATQSIREDDAKGRHTTTRRELHLAPGGFLVLDTPGMRELQLTDAASGIGEVFSDLDDLSRQCRFRDCCHETEPGCAVLQSVSAGEIDPMRVQRWRKLLAEDAFNSATLAERRSKDRAFGKMIRRVQADSRTKKKF